MSCDADDFLRSGRFIPHNRTQPKSKICHTPTTAHYSCSQLQSEGVQWEPAHPACRGASSPPLSAALLLGQHWRHRKARAQLNRTLFIIGDSTQKQAADSAFCTIATELALDATHEAPIFAKRAAQEWQWRRPSWFWQTTPSDAFQKRLVSCATAFGLNSGSAASAGSVTLCFIPSAALGRSVLEGRDASTVSGALRRIVVRNITRSTDIALINSGSWYMGQVSCGSGGLYIRDCDAAQAADAQAIVSLAASHAAAVPTLLWRETYASHFDTPTGIYDGAAHDQLRLFVRSKGAAGSKNLSLSRCKPLRTGATKPAVLANVSAILKERGSGVTVLDTWSLTRNLSVAMHANNPNRGPDELAAPDCLHFCSWIGVDETIVEAVAWAAAAAPAAAGAGGAGHDDP